MELSQYFKGMLRWWWLIILSILIAAGASYFASLKQPRIYQTTTTLMVGQVIQKTNLSGNDFVLTEQLAESYAQMATRQPVLQATVDALALEMGWQDLKWRVNAWPIPRTQLLAIVVQDVSPERAVAIADEIAYQLILQSPTSPDNQVRSERGDFVQGQLDDLELRIQTAQARVEELRTELDTAFSARQIQNIQTEIANLEKLINDWQGNYSNLLEFLQGGDSPNQLNIIEPAQLSYKPVSPNVQVNVLLAAAVGLTLGLGAALVLEYIDDTIKSSDDFASISLGLIPLGSIARINGDDYKDKLIISHDMFSPESEAYRLIRTNIQFAGVDQPSKSIMLTSPNPSEGKSTTTANLGVIMAQANLKTIIVDADLRQPTIHKIFQLPNLGGLTDLLCSPDLEVEAQLKNTGVENLRIITSGPLPPNPSEMLGSKRMAELIAQFNKVADVVIFDSPPVLAVTDATVLSKQVDGVILVARAKNTRRDSIKYAIQRLNQVGAKVLGGILNQASSRARNYQSYSQYYTHTEYSRVGYTKYTPLKRWWQRFIPVK